MLEANWLGLLNGDWKEPMAHFTRIYNLLRRGLLYYYYYLWVGTADGVMGCMHGGKQGNGFLYLPFHGLWWAATRKIPWCGDLQHALMVHYSMLSMNPKNARW